MNILSPEEKIRKKRRQIRASQEDLAGNKITRALVSQIENGKVQLTMNTAKILADNINKIIDMKEIKIDHVTAEELIESENEQIRKALEEFCNELKILRFSEEPQKALLKKVDEVELFLKDYRVDAAIKADIYENVADIFLQASCWNESEKYTLKSVEMYLTQQNPEKLLSIAGKLVTIYYRTSKYEDVISLGKMLKNTIMEAKNDYSEAKKIAFNIALAHSKLQQYDECLNQIRIIETMFQLSDRQKFDILMQKGHCCMKTGKLDEADSIFKRILSLAAETAEANAIARAYLNMALVKISLGHIEEAEAAVNSAEKIKVFDIYNKAHNHYNMVLIYIKLNKAKKIDFLYKDVLEDAIKIDSKEIQKDMIQKLQEYYIKNGHIKEHEEMLRFIERLVDNGKLKIRSVVDTFLVAAEHALSKGKDANSYMLSAIKISKSLRDNWEY